jgi:putative DNA primase/helicase
MTPADLAHSPIWVAWRAERRNGKPTKVPYDPRTGRRAAADDPATWATRRDAENWAATHGGAGIGVVLCPIDGAHLAGVDLDSCRDPQTGAVEPWAESIIGRLQTYSEVSPSGTGVKLIFRIAPADMPTVEALMDGKQGRQFRNGGGEHGPAIEVYCGGRYFAVTDDAISDSDELRQVGIGDLTWLLRDAGPKFAGKGKEAPGGRDNSRSAKAFRAGAALVALGASYEEMRDALLNHSDADVAAWAREKGLLAHERELRRVYDNAKAAPEPEEPTVEGLPFSSDEALALRFAENHAGSLRYVAGWNRWLSWTGVHWRADDTLAVWDRVRAQCREAANGRSKKTAKEITSAKTISAVERLARSDRRLAATIDQWDREPLLLNTPDGVVDLRDGRIRPHRPEDYMTKITAVGPRGEYPKWKAFLSRITNGDAALIAYLQRIAGYCLTGDTGEQAMFFAYGVGANGKGVFLQTLGRVLGDYCKTAAIETFTESKTDRHPTELARLHSARLVTATETESGRNWAESRIKMLTGGDTVAAHFMRQDDFEYVPIFKLFFSGNHKPGLRSVGEAMQRRVNMIPFAVIIPLGERNPHFGDRLRDEWAGILQWMVDGCLDWQERGLAPPEAVTKATEAYFVAQNSFSFWVEECCERDPNAWTKTTDLFASWKAWAEKAGVRCGDIKGFAEAMEAEGFLWKHSKMGNGYMGVRIACEPPPRGWHDDG